jgi:hypothetical protein
MSARGSSARPSPGGMASASASGGGPLGHEVGQQPQVPPHGRGGARPDGGEQPQRREGAGVEPLGLQGLLDGDHPVGRGQARATKAPSARSRRPPAGRRRRRARSGSWAPRPARRPGRGHARRAPGPAPAPGGPARAAGERTRSSATVEPFSARSRSSTASPPASLQGGRHDLAPASRARARPVVVGGAVEVGAGGVREHARAARSAARPWALLQLGVGADGGGAAALELAQQLALGGEDPCASRRRRRGASAPCASRRRPRGTPRPARPGRGRAASRRARAGPR